MSTIPNSKRLRLTPADALLELSRQCAQSREGGLLGEMLDLVLEAADLSRGMVFELDERAYSLVSDRGLTAALRSSVSFLKAEEFIAVRAVRRRRVLVEAEPAAGVPWSGSFAEAGWTHVLSAPISLGRQSFGVLVVASPIAIEPHVIDLVETATNIIALTAGLHQLREASHDRRLRASKKPPALGNKGRRTQKPSARAPERTAEERFLLGLSPTLREVRIDQPQKPARKRSRAKLHETVPDQPAARRPSKPPKANSPTKPTVPQRKAAKAGQTVRDVPAARRRTKRPPS